MNTKTLLTPLLATTSMGVLMTSTQADQTISGAVGLPLNPTAQTPDASEVHVQGTFLFENDRVNAKSNKASVFAWVEAPVTSDGRFAFVGELQSETPIHSLARRASLTRPRCVIGQLMVSPPVLASPVKAS